MSLKQALQRVLTEYLDAANEPFTQHPLANFIRRDLKDAVRVVETWNDRLIVKGSAGQGNWAKGPWVGVFDPLVTRTAQSGYYPVYAFREDMQGLYLCLMQGMTEVREHYKSDAKAALIARAANFRAMLGDETRRFTANRLDLAPSSPHNDTAFYEAANICAIYYDSRRIPGDEELIDDLKEMVRLYAVLVERVTNSETAIADEGDAPPELGYEDTSRFKLHKRIERNGKLAKDVKRLKGYTCEVCATNFEATYGEIGREFIEAHHLRPLSTLKGEKVALNPATDFAVLCSNCHRMIHRSGCVDDIEAFRQKHYRGTP